MESLLKCVACDGPMQRLGRSVDGVWPLHRCANCGLQSLHPQPEDQILEELYQQDYYKSWGVTKTEEPDYLRKMKSVTFRRQLKLLGTQIPQGHVLDVGCATGLFMETAQAAGYQASGLDISAFAVEMARKKFGDDAVFLGELSLLAATGRTFDAIVMSDYIEHVRDPLMAMRHACKLLRPGGCLLIQTPNAASISARLMGRRWTHYKLEHLWYFTPVSAAAIAERAGLRPLRVGSAKKALNLSYVRQQFSVYRHPVLSPLSRMLHAVALPPLRSMSIVLPAGELIGLFQKPE